MQDQAIFLAPLAPHTADVAELLAADHWDVADHVHELVLGAGSVSSCDVWMAGALLTADWEQAPIQVTGAAPQLTADVAEMIAAGHANAALDMYEAYVTAEFEREDFGASATDMLDIWMAGALLGATWECARADGALKS